MTDQELLIECKKGLNIPEESIELDSVLNQKLFATKIFMKNAGVTDANLANDLGVGVLVMGVSDLWELKSGEVKFSPAFFTLVNQLALG